MRIRKHICAGCTEQGSGVLGTALWEEVVTLVQALSTSSLVSAVTTVWRPLAPAPSGHHHSKLLVS